MKNKDLLEALKLQNKSLDLAEKIAKLKKEKRIIDTKAKIEARKLKTQMTKLFNK